MIAVREYLEPDAEQELQDEVDEIKDWLKKYTWNIDSLYGKEKASEVKKAMINYLVEQL